MITITKDKIYEYPMLLGEDGSDLIILMSSEGVGVVIVPNNSYSIGEYSDTWTMQGLTPYTGKIILGN